MLVAAGRQGYSTP